MPTAPQCNVFPSGVLGYVAQIALAVTSLLSLVIKYKLTGAGRTHGQYAVDTFKQVAGAFWIHLANMKCAETLAGTRIGHDISDECSWYLMQNIVDTAVGPVVAFAIFHQVLTSLRKAGYEPLVKEIVASERAPRDSELLSEPLIGQRRNSAGVPQTITLSIVTRQILTWLAVVTCMKFVMLAFLWVFSDSLIGIGQRVFAVQAGVKLLLVMIIVPFFTDLLQYWLFDNIFLDAYQQELRRDNILHLQQQVASLTGIICRNAQYLGHDDDVKMVIAEKGHSDVRSRDARLLNCCAQTPFERLAAPQDFHLGSDDDWYGKAEESSNSSASGEDPPASSFHQIA